MVFAFVEYKESEATDKAIHAMNGFKLADNAGNSKPMRVQQKDSKMFMGRSASGNMIQSPASVHTKSTVPPTPQTMTPATSSPLPRQAGNYPYGIAASPWTPYGSTGWTPGGEMGWSHGSPYPYSGYPTNGYAVPSSPSPYPSGPHSGSPYHHSTAPSNTPASYYPQWYYYPGYGYVPYSWPAPSHNLGETSILTHSQNHQAGKFKQLLVYTRLLTNE